ncbi:hypothetical protein [Rhodovibrio sodomensis]|uniref:hypothetical protein n=1 Tax=Rhodovibrio sodomensis TaxID=1088 RepID=UPI001A9111FC|nr:hypothetical protein [Rhodovibrio sodomensis]
MTNRTPRYGYARILGLLEQHADYRLVPSENSAGMLLLDADGRIVAQPRDQRVGECLDRSPDLVSRLERVAPDHHGVWHAARHRRHPISALAQT